jgi:SAM-dependent methyltransferase
VAAGAQAAYDAIARAYHDQLGNELAGKPLDRALLAPALPFAAGSMLQLPAADGALSGIIALYSIIHLTASDRARACREFARAVRPGGWLLAAFHVDSPDFAAGQVNHLTSWFGHAVELDGYFLEPGDVVADVQTAGFTVTATTIRSPRPDMEYPSRRCYLLAQRLPGG